jgi:uncharacterized protein YndB with AHSA1/START domain
MKVSDPPIIVEQVFNKSMSQVWEAITIVDQMTRWFFKEIPQFKAEVGFSIQFNVSSPDRDFLHHWTITEVLEPHKIVYHWNYPHYKGDSYVTFQLFNYGNRTRLVLTHKVVANFDDTIEAFKYESGLAGWNYFIKESLKNYLDT